MKIFKELKKLGYKHYTEHTVEELDNLPLESKERIIEQALVLRWFREKHKLEYHVKSDMMGYHIYIVDRNINKTRFTANNIFQTYEEAELECLKKLIEIVKTNKI
jgi:hypothetical protein